MMMETLFKTQRMEQPEIITPNAEIEQIEIMQNVFSLNQR